MLSDRRTRATGTPRMRTQRFYKARLVFQFTRRKSGIFEEEQQDKQHLKQDELVVFALFVHLSCRRNPWCSPFPGSSSPLFEYVSFKDKGPCCNRAIQNATKTWWCYTMQPSIRSIKSCKYFFWGEGDECQMITNFMFQKKFAPVRYCFRPKLSIA